MNSKLIKNFDVNIYLDFEKSHPRIAVCPKCRKTETAVGKDMQFREAVQIPVAVYHGTKEDGELVTPPQTMTFAQFGAARSMPLQAGPFESLSWAVAFQENGQMTEARFTSKSIGVLMTQFFGSAAQAHYAIATEQRNAANAQNSDTLRLINENVAIKA